MKESESQSAHDGQAIERRVERLLRAMTLAEKVGQMNQLHGDGPAAIARIGAAIRAGSVGSVLNLVDIHVVNELQRMAVHESRLGIPLLVGRDVIHGFKTVMPIPLGQAATFNPELVRESARVAAREATQSGVNWTFAPMIDLTRDPRWGRIAESLGEDAHLAGVMGTAMVQGFQGEDLTAADSMLACAKHFAGYGAVEAGRDYARVDISEHELRNFYLRPFADAIRAGVGSFMASFSELNGVPATANAWLMRRVLRDEWGFDGVVVSDWDSVRQLAIHGLTHDDRESAKAAVAAGIDMEMVGQSYVAHLPELVRDGAVEEATVDAMVANILRIKFRLGLFDRDYGEATPLPLTTSAAANDTAYKAALQSTVLLKNEREILPLAAQQLSSLAIIGPLAHAPHEQMGTWVFDGDVGSVVTPLDAIRDRLGESVTVRYVAAMHSSRARASAAFDEAQRAAESSDAVILFLGEESILSGEAHSRANIDLPGDQASLVHRIHEAGKPVVAVILAGRPLTLDNIVAHVDALLYAWHPGTMGGPAIADLLFGTAVPSGKLPVTFPRMVGQVPIYYNHTNTGKPPSAESVVHIDDIEVGATQTSLGMTSFHLDAGYEPLFAFGYGLSYTSFEYREIGTDTDAVKRGATIRISATVSNTGVVAADEIVQLYVRDLVGSVTRPVRELKGFRRVHLQPGEQVVVEFELHTDELAFYDRDLRLVTEPGHFHAWIGGSSEARLQTAFEVLD